MAISYRTPTVGQANTATSVSVNKPTGTVATELIRVLLSASAARTWNVPAGWALVPGTAAGDRTVALQRIADGSEGSSFTFTIAGGTANLRAGCVTTIGTDPTAPFDVSSFQQAASGTSNAIPGVTVTDGVWLDSLLFRVGSGAVVTHPGTMTEDFEDNSIQSFAGAHETATPGATGTRTWTWVGSSVTAGLLCSLKEPSGPVTAAPTLVGTSSLSVSGTQSIPATATLAGTGGLSVSGIQQVRPSVLLAGGSALSVSGDVTALPPWSGTGRTGPYDAARNAYNFKATNFARTRNAVAAGDLEVLVISDSMGVGYDGATFVDADSFPRRMLDTLAGDIGAGVAGPGISPVLVAANAAWHSDLWTFTGSVSTSASFAGLLQMNAGSTATLAAPESATDVDIYYSGISVPFTYQVDGGTAVPVTPSGASVVEKLTVPISGLSDAPHSIRINAPGTVYLAGVNPTDPGGGILLHNIGFGGTRAASGTAAQNWTNTAAAPPSAYTVRKRMADLAGLDPDLVIVALGGNDIFNNDTVANAIDGIDTIRSWYPTSDFAMVQAWEVPGTDLSDWDDYYAAKYQLADDLDVGFVDWRARSGDFTQANAAGRVGTDGVHPTHATQRDWGDNLADILANLPVEDVPATVTMTGAGGLSVSGQLQIPAAVTLAGSSALAVAGSIEAAAAVTIDGVGALAVTAHQETPAAVTLAGQSTLAVAGELQIPAPVTLAGASELLADGLLEQPATITLTGAGGLTATGEQQIPTTLTLTGIGVLDVAVSGIQEATAVLAGTGALTIGARQDVPAPVTLQGVGELEVTDEVLRIVTALLVGAGALSVDGQVQTPAQVTLAGVGALTVAAISQAIAGVQLDGVGTLTVDGTLIPPPGPTNLDYTATLGPLVTSATLALATTAELGPPATSAHLEES